MNSEGNTGATIAMSVALGVLAILCRAGNRGGERPSELVAWLWSALLAASAIVFPSPGISQSALFLIGLGIAGFAIGHRLGEAAPTTALCQNCLAAPMLAVRLRVVTALASLAAAASCIAYLRGAGLGWYDLATNPVHSALEASRYYTYARYTNPEFSEPSEAISLGIGTYYGSAAGGVLASLAIRRRDWAISAVPLVLGVATMVILTTRATMMFSAALWAAGYAAGQTWISHGRWRLLSHRRIALAAILFPVGLGLYLLMQALRRQSVEATLDTDVFDMATSAILGGPSALSGWLAKQELIVFGTRLCTGFARPFGFVRATIEPLPIGSLGAHANSNIITLIGDAVVDTGEVGCPVVLAFLGALAGASWRMARCGRIMGIPLLTSVLFVIFVSPIGSPLGYTVICAAIAVMFATFLYIPGRVARQ